MTKGDRPFPKTDHTGKRCGLQGCHGVWVAEPDTQRWLPNGWACENVVCSVCRFNTVSLALPGRGGR